MPGASVLRTALLFFATVSAEHQVTNHPGVLQFNEVLTNSTLQVDLGYAVYEGSYNASVQFNAWLGIRYAAAPIGNQRWRAPTEPRGNRSHVIQAQAFPPRCPQGFPAPVTAKVPGDEDCLFLSVFSPANITTDLPVLVWIHGGGYGSGEGNVYLRNISSINNYSFVSVLIQYRLGAFGFLSSDEVYNFGNVNAGLLDQHFALQWVQKYIHLFGGDPRRVTIAGESAGAGSVMLQSMAYGGKLGTSLFENIIAASPYLPLQYPYNGWQPSQAYYAFAQEAGCFPGRAYGNSSTTALDCLRQASSDDLQNANRKISASGTQGTWAFLPVTDGIFLQQRPSQQLLTGKVNGRRVLTGNNANEAVSFLIHNITTDADLEAWLRLEYPMLNSQDIYQILNIYYRSDGVSSQPYATCGDCPGGATAVNVGSFYVGPQQRALNLLSETTFVCSSYWLAAAFSPLVSGGGKQAYKYQYSIPASEHGADLNAVGLGRVTPNISPQFSEAFLAMWRNFITANSPSIPNILANGNESTATNAASDWPLFTTSGDQAYRMMNLNQTGGVEYKAVEPFSNNPSPTQYKGPGLQNDFRVVDAFAWEGGRGARCDFWRSIGETVPE